MLHPSNPRFPNTHCQALTLKNRHTLDVFISHLKAIFLCKALFSSTNFQSSGYLPEAQSSSKWNVAMPETSSRCTTVVKEHKLWDLTDINTGTQGAQPRVCYPETHPALKLITFWNYLQSFMWSWECMGAVCISLCVCLCVYKLVLAGRKEAELSFWANRVMHFSYMETQSNFHLMFQGFNSDEELDWQRNRLQGVFQSIRECLCFFCMICLFSWLPYLCSLNNSFQCICKS